MNCPKCNGPMNDVRGAKRSAKSPDWQCANRDGCGSVKNGKWYTTAAWENEGTRSSPAASTAAPARSSGAPKWTWPTLTGTYKQSLAQAAAIVKDASAAKILGPASPADVLSVAAVLFIAVDKGGIQEKAKPAPKPVPEQRPESLEELPPQLADDDDSLPF